MRHFASLLTLALPLFAGAPALAANPGAGQGPALAAKQNPIVVLETSEGTVEVELFEKEAPESVKNFLRYVDSKHYDGTVFHRVIPSFMIQGGGFDTHYRRKPTGEPIRNEADNGLKNKRFTLAMARTSVVHSATAQFFINTKDNPHLDHRSKDARGWGYAVFGQVVRGQDVVARIERTPTATCPGIPKDCPRTPIVIKKAYRKAQSAPRAQP